MRLRRFASLSFLTAALALFIGGSAGCVVHTRGAAQHAGRSCEHHCHPRGQMPNHFTGCHAHCHGPHHHN